MTVNARRAYVTLQYDVRPATVRGSRDQLSELAQNLCDNAIRYNRPGGHVELRCGVGGDGCPYFEVEDNGIGIPQDSQARVFERFYRVDKSRTKPPAAPAWGWRSSSTLPCCMMRNRFAKSGRDRHDHTGDVPEKFVTSQRGRGRTCPARNRKVKSRLRESRGPGMPGPYKCTHQTKKLPLSHEQQLFIYNFTPARSSAEPRCPAQGCRARCGTSRTP